MHLHHYYYFIFFCLLDLGTQSVNPVNQSQWRALLLVWSKISIRLEIRISVKTGISIEIGISIKKIFATIGHGQAGSEVKVSTWNARDPGSIPGLGRSSGEGNGNPLQYSCQENPMEGGTWQATVHGITKSRTRLRDFTFTFQATQVSNK